MSAPTCDPLTHPSPCACCEWRLTVELPSLRAKLAQLEEALAKENLTVINLMAELAAQKRHDRCNAGMRSRVKTLEEENDGLREFVEEWVKCRCEPETDCHRCKFLAAPTRTK